MSRGSVSRQESATLGAGITQQLVQAVAAAADRLYEAWTVRDTDQRAALLAEVCVDDVTYANPLKNCVGAHGIAEMIEELTAAYPGYLPVRISGLDAHHDAVRYEWAMRDRAGRAVLAGVEIVRFTLDARLTSIVSFFGHPPMIRYTYQA